MNQLKELFTKNERLMLLPDGISVEDVSNYLQSKEYLSQFRN